MMEPVEVIVLLIQLLTPFAVLFLGWRWTRLQSKNSEAKANERKLAEKERSEITKSMTEATTALNDARDDIEQITKQLHGIAVTTNLNGRCTSELAQLVMVLAEGLRDQHLDGNITRAVEKYRKFEEGEIARIMSDSNSTL